jgi:hypothetical protein
MEVLIMLDTQVNNEERNDEERNADTDKAEENTFIAGFYAFTLIALNCLR